MEWWEQENKPFKDYFKRIYDTLNVLAIGVTIAVFATLLTTGLDGLTKTASNFYGSQLVATDLLHLAVYIFLFYYTMAWLMCGWRELAQLEYWMKPKRYAPGHEMTGAFCILAVAILLMGLLIYVKNFFEFGVLFSLYTLVDLYLWKIRRQEIESAALANLDALKQSWENLSTKSGEERDKEAKRIELYALATKVIRTFYVHNHHYNRVVVQSAPIWVMAMVSFCIQYNLLMGPISKIANWISKIADIDYLAAGYLIFLLCATVGEIRIYRWRAIKNVNLDRLAISLRELD